MTRILPFFLLAACTFPTTIRDQAGRVRFRTHANIRKVYYADEGVKFYAEYLNHSAPITAGGKAFSGAVGNLGSVLTAGGAVTLIP